MAVRTKGPQELPALLILPGTPETFLPFTIGDIPWVMPDNSSLGEIIQYAAIRRASLSQWTDISGMRILSKAQSDEYPVLRSVPRLGAQKHPGEYCLFVIMLASKASCGKAKS